mgnify:FL=1
MLNELITIIIPIYNVDKYLKRCLDSVLNQEYSNIQVILIDDGSNDMSSLICDEYVKKDKRCEVIHINNQGVSHARNEGIKLAKGQYLTFVDADDWVEQKIYVKLYENIKKYNADISICNYQIRYDESRMEKNQIESRIDILEKNDAIKLLIEEKYFGGFLMNKLFSADVIKKIALNEEIYILEDLLFCYEVFNNAKKIVYDSENLYNYYQRETSALHKRYSWKNLTGIWVWEYLRKKEIEKDNNDIVSRILLRELMPINKSIVYLRKDLLNKKLLYSNEWLNNKRKKYLNEVIKASNVSKKEKIRIIIWCITPKLAIMLGNIKKKLTRKKRRKNENI